MPVIDTFCGKTWIHIMGTTPIPNTILAVVFILAVVSKSVAKNAK